MRRLLAILGIMVLALSMTACSGGGSDDPPPDDGTDPPPDDGTDPPPDGEDAAPTLGAGGAIEADSPMVTIEPGANDDGALTITWAVGNDESPVASADDLIYTVTDSSNGSTDFTFPRKGSYELVVTADDGVNDPVSAIWTVTFADTVETFAIAGSIADDDGSGAAPVESLNVELYWMKIGGDTGQIIGIEPTTDAGDFRFGDLLGSATDFQVEVPGSTGE